MRLGCLFTLLSSGNQRWKRIEVVHMGRWWQGDRSVWRTLWRKLERLGDGQHKGDFGVSNSFIKAQLYIVESKRLSLSFFFWTKYSSPQAWSRTSEPTVEQEARSKEQHYNVGSPHPWRSCGEDRGVTGSKENRQWLRNTSSTQPALDLGQQAQEDSLCDTLCHLCPFKIWDPLEC